jgi:hypothetical protein
MPNYYRYNRSNQGRYARRSFDWTKLVNDVFDISVSAWVGFTIIDIILKAHGL